MFNDTKWPPSFPASIFNPYHPLLQGQPMDFEQFIQIVLILADKAFGAGNLQGGGEGRAEKDVHLQIGRALRMFLAAKS